MQETSAARRYRTALAGGKVRILEGGVSGKPVKKEDMSEKKRKKKKRGKEISGDILCRSDNCYHSPRRVPL